MKSHAKAVSAGSTSSRGIGLGSISRGALATRGSSLSADGSGAPSHRRARLTLVFATALLALLIAVASAQASKGVVSFIGSTSSGTAEGQFSTANSGPGGVAVNQAGNDTTGNSGAAAGDVYIVDRGNNRVQQFSSAGTFIRTFGLNVGGAAVNVCTSSCVAGTSSAANAGMNAPQGVAVDQTNGLVYVSDQGNKRIDVFAANGDFQGAFGQNVDATVAGTGFEFCPSTDTCQAGASTNTGFAGAFGTSLGYPAVAPSGDILVADTANNRVQQFTPTITAGAVTAVAFTRAFGGGVVDGGATATATLNSSTSVTSASTTSGAFAVGQKVTSSDGGIPAGTTITAIGSSTLTLSQAATTSGAVTLTVAPGSGNNSSNNELQTITIAKAGGLLSGYYKLKFTSPNPGGATLTSGNISYDASPADVQSTLEALSNIGAGNVTVTSPNPGGAGLGGPYTVEFKGRYADTNVNTLVKANGSPNLKGASAKIDTTQEGGSAAEVCTAASGDLCQAGLAGTDLGQFSANFPTALAVDSAGNSYVNGANRVQKFNSAGGSPSSFADAQLSTNPASDPVAVAVNRSNDHVFVAKPCNSTICPNAAVSNENRVLEFDNSGASLLDTHASGAAITNLNGMALAQSSGKLYVTTSSFNAAYPNNGAFVLTDTLVPPLATIDSGSGFTHAATTATFTGTVNPVNFTTGWHFEYSTDDVNWTKVPTSDTALSFTDNTAHAVSQAVTGLLGSQLYHVRLVATKAFGAGVGTSSETTFTTDPGPPVISATAPEWNSIDTTAATVDAGVNPQNQGTAYHVEYVTQADFDQSGYANAQTTAGVGIGNGGADVAASTPLSGLSPATTYHFRFVATNPSGTSDGADSSFTTYADLSLSGSCSNDSFRTGPSANLSDCRAYEQVSPVDKNGGDIGYGPGFVQASTAGDRLTLAATTLPSSTGNAYGENYIASRAPGGWATDGLLPAADPGYPTSELGWSDDLTNISQSYSPGAPGLYLRDPASGAQQLVVPGATSSFNSTAIEAFAADDNSHLLLTDKAILASGAVNNKPNLYDLNHGTITLAGRVPAFPATSCDDTNGPACADPAAGSFAGSYDWLSHNLTRGGQSAGGYYTQNTISADGSKVFFTEGGTGRLDMRVDNTKTVQVSADQGGNDPGGHKPAAWLASTPSGSKVFFASCEKLTADSTAVSTAANSCTDTTGSPNHDVQGSDLYSYDTASGDLTDLSVDSNAGDLLGADIQGMVGASPDGSDVYFVANGVLASGAAPGNCNIGSGFSVSGTCNLYLSHNSAITFVAPLTAGSGRIDAADWEPNGSSKMKTSRVAADGTLVFASSSKLTAYDNGAAAAGECGVNGAPAGSPCDEFYRYQPGDAAPSCVSCDPTGAPPTGDASIFSSTYLTISTTSSPLYYLTRNLSTDGTRFFFESPDKLVPADTNGEGGCPKLSVSVGAGNIHACQDIYEWEANGAGSCHSSAANGGCLYLLSTGAGTEPAVLGDASASGDDAFIFTRDPLVPADQDQILDAYDVRVDGGLASQHPDASAPPCDSTDSCHGQGTTAPPTTGAGSASFSGPGNPAIHHKAKKKHHKAKRKHHKKRKHKAKKHHKRHAKRHHKRANSNRGGQK